jgi:hypothetical protein
LKQKYNDYVNNKINKHINNENRGGINKIFTENEEQQIFNYLKENFIDKNKILCNEIIKLYAIEECKNYIPILFLKPAMDGQICLNTKWNNINVSLTTIHIKGTYNSKINVNGNDKEGFTLTLIVNAIGKRGGNKKMFK